MSLEAGVLIDENNDAIYWHTPPDRSVGYLPDSRPLWDVIWASRKNLSGFAHSHPGKGLPWPSNEDLSTFKAVESALGRSLSWYITSEDTCIVVRSTGTDFSSYYITQVQVGHLWLPELRYISYNQGESDNGKQFEISSSERSTG